MWLYSLVRACHLGKLLAGGGDVLCCWSDPSVQGVDGSCIFHPSVSVSIAYGWLLERDAESASSLLDSDTMGSGSSVVSSAGQSAVRGESGSIESSAFKFEYSRFAIKISCPCHISSIATKPSPPALGWR